jgi:hypothetical protein
MTYRSSWLKCAVAKAHAAGALCKPSRSRASSSGWRQSPPFARWRTEHESKNASREAVRLLNILPPDLDPPAQVAQAGAYAPGPRRTISTVPPASTRT